uniref:alpha/beta fold hydrolase n=1 Tax=Thaumasiovibrio occultus TaxID=1891184 RepID=UPI000B3517D5|nr:alpha/beta hydrolase [Thaumasiovibrio occultus]
MIPHSQFFSVDDAVLHFTDSGNTDAHPLLLLHGGLGSIDDMSSLLPYIPAHYRVIQLDLRGHGQSTLGTQPLSYQRYEQDIEALLTHLGINTFALLGFSDGGITAYRLAAKHPERVTAVVTLGAQWRLDDNDPSREMLEGLTADFWRAQFPQTVEHYNNTNPAADFDQLVAAVKTLWLDNSASGYPNTLVTEISCPILIMRGEHDYLFSLEEAVALIQQIPNAHFMNIPFAEHEAQREVPFITGAAVQHFLSLQLDNNA